MSEIIVPSLPKDTNVPLYVAFGLTSRESDVVYFAVTEWLNSGKTVAEVLKLITENQKWNTSMKVWGAYNLPKEIMKRKTKVPAFLLDKIL